MSSTGTPPKRTTKKQKRKCDTLGRTTEVTDISKTTAAEYIRRLFYAYILTPKTPREESANFLALAHWNHLDLLGTALAEHLLQHA